MAERERRGGGRPESEETPATPGGRAAPEEAPAVPGDAATAARQQTERVTALPPGGGAPQEQPPSLMEAVRHEVTPGVGSEEERRGAGADPADRDAMAREAEHEGRREHRRWTVLHPVIHDGRTYHPGSELGEEDKFTELHAQPLIEAGRIVEGAGDDVAEHVHRAHMARHSSLLASGVPAGPPPEPPQRSERHHRPSAVQRAQRLGVAAGEEDRQVARESFPED
jgi:hypothetical protein